MDNSYALALLHKTRGDDQKSYFFVFFLSGAPERECKAILIIQCDATRSTDSIYLYKLTLGSNHIALHSTVISKHYYAYLYKVAIFNQKIIPFFILFQEIFSVLQLSRSTACTDTVILVNYTAYLT